MYGRTLAAPVALLATLASCESRSFTATDRAAVEQVLSAQAQAWNSGDLPRFMAGYAAGPDLIFTSGGKVRRGYDQARARYEKAYAAGNNMGTLAFEVLDVRGLGRDAATVLGTWKLSDTKKAGHGVFTLVFERQAAGWKIIHDHTSAADADADADE